MPCKTKAHVRGWVEKQTWTMFAAKNESIPVVAVVAVVAGAAENESYVYQERSVDTYN